MFTLKRNVLKINATDSFVVRKMPLER